MAKRRKAKRKCGIFGCEREARSKGKCDAHYHRDRKWRRENGIGPEDAIPPEKLAAYEEVMRRPVASGEGDARLSQVELLRVSMQVVELLRPLTPQDRRDVLHAAQEVLK